MSSPSLNAAPSPSDPLQNPPDELIKAFALLYSAASDLQKLLPKQNEPDINAMAEIDRIKTFADAKITKITGASSSMGAPASMPPPPPQMAGAGSPAAVGPTGIPGLSGLPGSPPATGGIGA